MSRKENLPLNMEQEKSSSITYADDVIATIAGIAAGEVSGIAEMCSVSGSGVFGKNKNITRGVKVEVGTEEVGVDLYIIVEYGTPIQQAAKNAQESVRKAIEEMTGMHAVRVDVHVQGVRFDKEKEALSAGEKNAALAEGEKKSAEKPAVKPEIPEETEETVEETPETAESDNTSESADTAEMETGEALESGEAREL